MKRTIASVQGDDDTAEKKAKVWVDAVAYDVMIVKMKQLIGDYPPFVEDEKSWKCVRFIIEDYVNRCPEDERQALIEKCLIQLFILIPQTFAFGDDHRKEWVRVVFTKIYKRVAPGELKNILTYGCDNMFTPRLRPVWVSGVGEFPCFFWKTFLPVILSRKYIENGVLVFWVSKMIEDGTDWDVLTQLMKLKPDIPVDVWYAIITECEWYPQSSTNSVREVIALLDHFVGNKYLIDAIVKRFGMHHSTKEGAVPDQLPTKWLYNDDMFGRRGLPYSDTSINFQERLRVNQ